MCIFTNQIDDVHSTKILARLCGSRQALIYEMYLTTGAETAMVLPLPVQTATRATAVEFIDLSDYQDIFKDIEALFPQALSFSSRSSSRGFSSPTLEVRNVGSFEASYVPSPTDFNRLDTRFQLKENLLQSLPQYRDYGFVVFKLRSGSAQIHPMAFWFNTRAPERIYFPTVHVHDNHVQKLAEFDHLLYAQGSLSPSEGSRTTTYEAENGSKIKAIAHRSRGLISSGDQIHKLILHGELANRDTWLPLAQDPPDKTPNNSTEI